MPSCTMRLYKVVQGTMYKVQCARTRAGQRSLTGIRYSSRRIKMNIENLIPLVNVHVSAQNSATVAVGTSAKIPRNYSERDVETKLHCEKKWSEPANACYSGRRVCATDRNDNVFEKWSLTEKRKARYGHTTKAEDMTTEMNQCWARDAGRQAAANT